jgi:hypothetical protein
VTLHDYQTAELHSLIFMEHLDCMLYVLLKVHGRKGCASGQLVELAELTAATFLNVAAIACRRNGAGSAVTCSSTMRLVKHQRRFGSASSSARDGAKAISRRSGRASVHSSTSALARSMPSLTLPRAFRTSLQVCGPVVSAVLVPLPSTRECASPFANSLMPMATTYFARS